MSLEEIRKKKLEALRNEGIDPYPAKVWRTHTCQQVIEQFDQLLSQEITIVGRLKTLRAHGKSAFADLEDGTGKLQIYFKQDLLGEKKYKILQEMIDLGDFLECRGNLMKTKTGEKTLVLNNFRVISKSLLPLPEKWHGLEDVEIRYRQRYLDLIANPKTREIFLKRSAMIKAIRKFFDQEDFVEVETPILQSIPGGAAAKPFVTHHDAFDIDLYLSIAPELYLKRLIIGGFEKVFEVARCFRNEGIDWSHNPEFSQIEFYQAFADYQNLMDLTERLIVFILDSLFREFPPKACSRGASASGGDQSLPRRLASLKLRRSGQAGLAEKIPYKIKYRDEEIDFTPPYPRKKYVDAVKEYAGIDLNQLRDHDALYKEAKKLNLEVEKKWSWSKIVDEIFKEMVRPKIKNPIFIINHPVELSPLAKRTPDDPNYVERFQLMAAGFELCNAFSELNDPIDQEVRFKAQQALRKAGEEEAQMYDQDFIEALKYGMPPTAGCGIGIDRLIMLLTDAKNIREVILFPTLKPRNL